MPLVVNPPPPEGGPRFRPAWRWLVLSVVGVAIAAAGIILRVITGKPGSYDVVASFGIFLVILGGSIARFVGHRRQTR